MCLGPVHKRMMCPSFNKHTSGLSSSRFEAWPLFVAIFVDIDTAGRRVFSVYPFRRFHKHASDSVSINIANYHMQHRLWSRLYRNPYPCKISPAHPLLFTYKLVMISLFEKNALALFLAVVICSTVQ